MKKRLNSDFYEIFDENKINLKSEKSDVFARRICKNDSDVIGLSERIIEKYFSTNQILNQDLIIVFIQ